MLQGVLWSGEHNSCKESLVQAANKSGCLGMSLTEAAIQEGLAEQFDRTLLYFPRPQQDDTNFSLVFKMCLKVHTPLYPCRDVSPVS